MGAEDTKIQLMRHRVLALGLAAMALCTSVNAQTGKKGTDEFRVTAGYTFGLTEGAGGAVSLTPEYGHYFSDQFYFGMVPASPWTTALNPWLSPCLPVAK